MTISLHNRQRRVPVDLAWLKKFARVALARCVEVPPLRNATLTSLPFVEVSIVSDPAIADVHREFMHLPGPTDVITFDHGEILISADTALANAQRYRQPLKKEIALYIIHGMLHLNGFTDRRRTDAAKMRRVQNRILTACLKTLS